MLESVVSWFTPTALFLLLNLVIGSIAFTSYVSSPDPSKLFRSPSIVLDRHKSFNLCSSYQPSDPATTEIPKSEQCEPEPEPEPKPVTKPEPQPEQEHPIVRSQSETQPAGGEMRKKLHKKMKKSATLNRVHLDFYEPEKESSPPKRPATMREREREKEQKEEDAEEDARADDFINRFKQQLKLDSIIRYKKMLNRGN